MDRVNVECSARKIYTAIHLGVVTGVIRGIQSTSLAFFTRLGGPGICIDLEIHTVHASSPPGPTLPQRPPINIQIQNSVRWNKGKRDGISCIRKWNLLSGQAPDIKGAVVNLEHGLTGPNGHRKPPAECVRGLAL
ncbi:hypothetical protein CDAR_565731 [Caerostris darwini]|uniref:Uncharacterized protein n=1 Tax=Caerostris darwini TaxID=1538125 RepID=A0AAV4UXX3_9ARAC|nr:hypothetical protein CDAR_565731 [Caerostris darwini]